MAGFTCGLFLLLAYGGAIESRAQQAAGPGSRSSIFASGVKSAADDDNGRGSIAAVADAPGALALTDPKGEELRAAMNAPGFAMESVRAAAPGIAPAAVSHLSLPDSVLHPDLRCEVSAKPFTDSPRMAGGDGLECVRFAEVLDSAQLSSAALDAWEKVIGTHPDMERAQVRVAQLLLQAGNAPAAENAARYALQVLPKSPSLYLVASEAAQREGKEYEARRLLAEGLSATNTEELLVRLTAMQDAHGDGAAELYGRVAEETHLPAEKRLAALERGFEVALRDADVAQARALGERLKAAGHPEFQPVIQGGKKFAGEAVIPGGMDGLAFMAMTKRGTSAHKFLAEFARALLGNVCTGICFGRDEYKKMVEDYFATVSQLESQGKRDQHRVLIQIAVGNPEDERRTARVLGLLGVELHHENGTIRLEAGVKERQAKKQDMVGALGIDLLDMQTALQAGKPYTLEIDDDPVEIYPNAGVWEDAFPGKSGPGLAQMLLRQPRMARLYLSISDIDAHTLEALFGAVSPSELATQFADELARFGPAFAVSGTRAVVPGGDRAAPVWKELAGVSPDEPGPFFRALLSSPQLLSFFYAVSELDARHQAFFTSSPERALRFFTLSRGMTAEREYHKDLSVDSSFTKLMRSVPLDDDGHVIFPGSPAVWLVAKGNKSNDRQISALVKRAAETGAPGMEDAILSHLAETAYEIDGIKNSELDNFLAVSHLNAHLQKPMSEESALLLAQHYNESWPLYPYLSDLPEVNTVELRNLFSILDKIRNKPKLMQNLEMGQLYSLLGWVSILGRTEIVDREKVADLFSQVAQALQTSLTQGQTSTASLRMARSIVSACESGANENLDAAVRRCMLRGWSEADGRRAEDFERVLELQSAPSLADLEVIANAAESVVSMPGAMERVRDGARGDSTAAALRADAARISEAASHLPAVEIPRMRRVSSREREAIEAYDPGPVRQVAAELKEIAAKPRPVMRAARRAARELLTAIRAQATAALAAPIYAYYLRSTDLIISEDRLLLRKHRYVDYITPLGGNHIVEEERFLPSSEGVGSHFLGGFATFALTAAHATAAGLHQGGQGAEAMIAAQIAAIRSVPWKRLSEGDQRLAALRILAAREWIVRSATDPRFFESLSSATLGILSLARRSDLLNSIENRDWDTVWKSVPLPDLYTLGSEYGRESTGDSDQSPVFAELHALEAAGKSGNIDYLGHIPKLSHGCGHLHLSVDAPYEEYERRLMEEDLAERTADFKLYLAVRADNAGVEPSELEGVAEKLAAKAFAASQLSDYHDWRSLFAAYSSITTNDLRRALEP